MRDEPMKKLLRDHHEVMVSPGCTFGEALKQMERVGRGIILIADGQEHLLGVMTDGDIRKAVLKGITLDDPVTLVMNPTPVVITEETTPGELYRFMQEKGIRYVPSLDRSGRLEGILYEKELRGAKIITCPAVIMAGGLGTRLRPLTANVPKPLLPVGGKPMIQHVIESLRGYGINEFFVSVNYKAEMIEEFLGDGSDFRVRIEYLREKKRLGTAGALSLIRTNGWQDIFVLNSDVMTDLDFHAMYQFHLDHEHDLTMAVKRFNLQVPYGVVEMDMNRVVSLSEKPNITNYVNAGIYLLNRRVLGDIPRETFFNMTDLITNLVDQSRNVASYLIKGDWTDVGLPEEYDRLNGLLKPVNEAETAKASNM